MDDLTSTQGIVAMAAAVVALAALVFAIGGDAGPAGLFVAVAAAQGLLAVTTRYSARA